MKGRPSKAVVSTLITEKRPPDILGNLFKALLVQEKQQGG